MQDFTLKEFAEFINAINHADANAKIEINKNGDSGVVGAIVGGGGFTVKITPVEHEKVKAQAAARAREIITDDEV